MNKEQYEKIIVAARQAVPDIITAEWREIEIVLAQMIDDPTKIPFSDFWTKYPKKERKLVTNKKWNMMSRKHQELAIAYIPMYIMKKGDYIQMPENYLHTKPWMDEDIIRTKTKEDLLNEDRF